ncbi:MAG: hypothetical protein JW722_08740 [Demequinaceae bacterium]|nr:hypothetical protein [Demequinaceae bacterium]
MARRIRWAAAAVAVLAAVGAGLAWGPDLWHRYGDRLFSTESCTATVDGESSSLTAEQADNAALIVAIGTSRGLPERAKTIALATALQESDLRNLELGDRDSLGLFQQRPSQGWGTPEQILNPEYAANAFYDALLRVEGWESMSVTQAAQAVQRSGFPDAYARHEARAEIWATALSGQAGTAAVSCSLGDVEPSSTAVEALRERLGVDFGSLVEVQAGVTSDGHVGVTLGIDPSLRDAVMVWTIAVASTQSIEGVGWCGSDWIRDDGNPESILNAYRSPACLPDEILVVLAVG